MSIIQKRNNNMFSEDNQVSTVNSALTEIEKSRAVQEVQAALVIAKKFPRDLNQVFTRIISSCKRLSLAEKAIYSYPRGGTTVSGPSIRLAEVMAQNYGNLDFGVRELERKDGSSIAESYCWDMETNVRQTKTFEIAHEIHLKNGSVKRLTDPRDIYERVANDGARRLRACILGIIPIDIQESAREQCAETVAKGDGKTPFVDRVRKMVVSFQELGVSQEMIEKRIKHKMDLTTAEEFVELTAIYTSIRDKHGKPSSYFEFPDDAASNNPKTNELDNILKDSKAEVKDADPNSFANFKPDPKMVK